MGYENLEQHSESFVASPSKTELTPPGEFDTHWQTEMNHSAPSTPFDVQHIRADFPILAREVRPGVPLVYLDSTATAQKPCQVIEAIETFYRCSNANVHRGIHFLAEEATAQYEAARERVAKFIGAASPRQIVFTRNTTEAINLVAYSWGRANLQVGDLIV